MFVLDKVKIVDTIYPLLSDHYRNSGRDRDYCLTAWWKNIRPKGGLSLTFEGQAAFKDAQIACYEFEYGPAGYVAMMGCAVRCDKKIPCPHYVRAHNKKIFIDIYDGRIAMNIALYGSIQRYLSKIDNISQGE